MHDCTIDLMSVAMFELNVAVVSFTISVCLVSCAVITVSQTMKHDRRTLLDDTRRPTDRER